MNRLAKIISVLLHPLVMPLYAMILMLWTTPFGLLLYTRVKLLLVLSVFVFTCITPLFFILILHKTGAISSLSIRERGERVVPLLFGALMCYMNYVFLARVVRLHPLFPRMFFALALFLLMLAIITKFWKISLHMAAIGGLLFIFCTFSLYDNFFWIIALLAGALGSSRLQLGAHNSLQVYVGFLLGVLYFLCYFIS